MDVIRTLKQNGADLDATDNYGDRALYVLDIVNSIIIWHKLSDIFSSKWSGMTIIYDRFWGNTKYLFSPLSADTESLYGV